jgi:hypothetical protein
MVPAQHRNYPRTSGSPAPEYWSGSSPVPDKVYGHASLYWGYSRPLRKGGACPNVQSQHKVAWFPSLLFHSQSFLFITKALNKHRPEGKT